MVNENMGFISLVVSLFLVFNAVGQIPLFLAMLAPYSHKRQKIIIVRELLIALATILLFNFFGYEILNVLGITHNIIRIAGGLLLVIIALNLIFSNEDLQKQSTSTHEPIAIPLAIPGLAGPGTITAVMVFSTQLGVLLSATAFILAWIPSLLIILAASYIKKYVGEKGLLAIQRLGGMIVCLIGIQMLTLGIIQIVKDNFF